MAASLTAAAAPLRQTTSSRAADRQRHAAQPAAAAPAAAAATALGRATRQRPSHTRRSQRTHWIPAASASEGNGAAAPAEVAPAPAAESRSTATWLTLLRSVCGLVQSNLWPLVLVHCLADAAVFLLHRASHRLTNQGESDGSSTNTALSKPPFLPLPSTPLPNLRTAAALPFPSLALQAGPLPKPAPALLAVAASMLRIDLSQVNPWYPGADPAVANFQTGRSERVHARGSGVAVEE